MVTKIIGAGLIIVGCLLFGVLISGGMLFPHIIGPIVLATAGIALLAIKRKGASNE